VSQLHRCNTVEESGNDVESRIVRNRAWCICNSFATLKALLTSAVWDPRADVQIGGGVRVSDAFQAKLSW